MANPTTLVASLPASVPFVGPEAQERSAAAPFDTRLGANENVFGPSPKAIAAMQKAAGESWKYGDPENHDLKTALAAHHGVGFDNIVVGEGIDGLLGLTVRIFAEAGDAVVTSQGAYPTFNYQAAGNGARLVAVPYAGNSEDPDALLAAAKAEEAKLIYFANPDNPMGSWHDGVRVQQMIDAVPGHALLCLDEAYGEFAPAGTLPPFDVNNPNVIRFRTFSKAYGMAGARIAYAIGHADVIAQFNKVRNHFGVNRIAQAGALAALADADYLQEVLDRVSSGLDRLRDIAKANGLTPLPTATNFLTIDCGRDAAFAVQLVQELARLRVFVRMPFAEPHRHCIRVSAGAKEDLDIFEGRLPAALQAASDTVS